MARLAYRRPVKTAVAFFEEKLKYEIGPAELKERMDHNHNDFVLFDVRTSEAYKEGHIPGAVSIPYHEVRDRISDFSEEKENIIYCYTITCFLAYEAARFLAEKGYQVKVLVGGFEEWQRSMLHVSTL
jgi:rhodanese-related sulfurtransferase